ncbi:hypothetical protein FACS1894120_5070 [Clostridia bacterium]|nr:hypothetical protein FACS1894120_5070 [Clostridia bacterium]
MNQNAELNNRIFDAKLAQALKEDMIAEMNSVSMKTDHIFSEKFERNVRPLLNRTLFLHKTSKMFIVTKKFAAVAAAMLICVGIGATPRVSAYMQNIFVKIFPQYDSYTFLDKLSSDVDFYSFKAGWLPRSYELRAAKYIDDMVDLKYENVSGGNFTLSCSTAEHSNLTIDNEHFNSETIRVNGSEAHLYTVKMEADINDGWGTILVWENDGVAFNLTDYGSLSRKDIIKIAENVEIN